MDGCSTPEWGRLGIFDLGLLSENTVFSDSGSVLEKSLVTVLVTVGVGDLRRLHQSWNTDVVILLFLTFVVTRDC